MLLTGAPDYTGASSMILTHDRRRALVLLGAGLFVLPLRAAAQQAPTSLPPSAAEEAPATTLPAPSLPEPPPSAAATTLSPAPSAPVDVPVAPPPPPAADTAALEQRVEAVEKRLDLLAPLKITGFVQAQYTRNDTSNDTLD